MNSEFELIRYNDNLPARIDIKQGEINTLYHWHKEIELIYVLDGELEININNTAQTLHTDEFRLINSVENHSLSAENTKYLILDISYEFASQFDESLYSSVFKVIGGSGAEEELRNLLWQLSRTVNEPKLPDLRQYSIITDILHVLFVQCRHENPNAVKEGETSSLAMSSWRLSISSSTSARNSPKKASRSCWAFSRFIYHGGLRKLQARASRTMCWNTA